MSKPPPPAPTASAIGPCPTVIKIVGRPGTGSLPSTIAPPDHPQFSYALLIILSESVVDRKDSFPWSFVKPPEHILISHGELAIVLSQHLSSINQPATLNKWMDTCDIMCF